MSYVEQFVPYEIPGKDWGQELLIGHAPGLYTLKKLTYRAGADGPLQRHLQKDETFHLVSGAAEVIAENDTGCLQSHTMKPGQSFHIPRGAVHRFRAITECVVFEASTAYFDDRENAEAEFDSDGQRV